MTVPFTTSVIDAHRLAYSMSMTATQESTQYLQLSHKKPDSSTKSYSCEFWQFFQNMETRKTSIHISKRITQFFGKKTHVSSKTAHISNIFLPRTALPALCIINTCIYKGELHQNSMNHSIKYIVYIIKSSFGYIYIIHE